MIEFGSLPSPDGMAVEMLMAVFRYGSVQFIKGKLIIETFIVESLL